MNQDDGDHGDVVTVDDVHGDHDDHEQGMVKISKRVFSFCIGVS